MRRTRSHGDCIVGVAVMRGRGQKTRRQDHAQVRRQVRFPVANSGSIPEIRRRSDWLIQSENEKEGKTRVLVAENFRNI